MFKTTKDYCLISFFPILCLLIRVNCDNDDSMYSQVTTEYGQIRGIQETTIFKQNRYYAFRGIPYAKPPVGELRFLPPQKPDNWGDNVRDTIEYGSECLQVKGGQTQVTGSENCLSLNVYSPNLTVESKLPVIFLIHGGAFVEGSGTDFLWGPDFLVEKDVILVTVNYRLSVFGFMSLGTGKYSGNMGVKDAVMALQWTRENIRNFGGDPDNISVCGISAGSVIAHLLTISPVSHTLFKRAMIQSGTAMSNVIVDYKLDHREMMIEYVKSKNKDIVEEKDLVEFLKNADAADLYTQTYYIFKETDPGQRLSDLIFKPMVENEDAEQPFLTDLPEKVLANNPHDLDIMFGYTANESLFAVSKEARNYELLKPFDERFEIVLPHRELNNLGFHSEKYKEMAAKVREFYFGGRAIGKDTFSEYIDLLSDTVMFVHSYNQVVRMNLKHSTGKTFFYRFSVDKSFNLLKNRRDIMDIRGTAHADDVCYLFKCKIFIDNYSNLEEFGVERQIIETMATLWTNFAKFGNPTPDHIPIEWKPVTENHIHFVDITNDGCVAGENPNLKSYLFWEQLFDHYKDV